MNYSLLDNVFDLHKFAGLIEFIDLKPKSILRLTEVSKTVEMVLSKETLDKTSVELTTSVINNPQQ